MFANLVRYLFFLIFVKPFIYLVLGVNVIGAEYLQKISKEPGVIITNHNSHVDILLLMSLFSCGQILKIHPVAAADYFCNTKLKAFIFKTLLGIIPLDRKVKRMHKEDIFKDINESLKRGETIIIFPEGTRGEDNTIKSFKSGIGHIAQMNPDVPVYPMYINGPDRILPKTDFLWVPFICDVYATEPVKYDNTSPKEFAEKLHSIVLNLRDEHKKKEEL